MPTFTLELSWLVPSVVTIQVEAETVQEAIDNLDFGEVDYDGSRMCWDGSSDTRITGAWLGESDYVGENLVAEDRCQNCDQQYKTVDILRRAAMAPAFPALFTDEFMAEVQAAIGPTVREIDQAQAEALATAVHDQGNGALKAILKKEPPAEGSDVPGERKG